MSTLNPYAAHIGNAAPLETIAATPARLRELVAAIGPARLTPLPAPGKWSARDIVCHLADTEIAFGFRLRQALAEPHHVIQPFDQDLWAARYGDADIQLALNLMEAVRAANLALLRSLTAADLAKPVTHPERGLMTLATVLETMAGHDRNHIRQIEAIAAQAAGAGN